MKYHTDTDRGLVIGQVNLTVESAFADHGRGLVQMHPGSASDSRRRFPHDGQRTFRPLCSAPGWSGDFWDLSEKSGKKEYTTRRGSFLSIGNIEFIASMAVTTTISISRDTKELLRKMGEKGESYDAIIRKLLREANWKILDERWNNIVDEDEFIPLEAL